MADPAIFGATAAELAALVRARDATAVDVVRACLERIAGTDPRIGAFQVVRHQKALDEAAALDRRGDLSRLALAGVPIAVKNNLPVAGEPMRLGSRAVSDAPSASDHETVRRLRAAGAIVVGLTRLPELGAWATTDSAFGVTRNPWNLERTTGGSSGGSAAAVAAAMVPIALGNDGMGSIRIPAACCGVFGMKPGPDLVPSELGRSSWFGLAENGPIATAVEDAASMLSVLANRSDLASVRPPERPLRIAVTTRSPLAGVNVDRELRQAVMDDGNRLAAAGHVVEEADPPGPTFRAVVAILAHWFAGAADDAESLDARLLERRTRTHARLGRLVRRARLVRARDRDDWRARNDPFFERYDVLLSPVLASLPIAADRWSERGWAANAYANTRYAPFPAAWNFAGYPAAAVPAGVTAGGIPRSTQLVASRGREKMVLAVARQLEMLRPWPRHAPSTTRV